MSLRQTPSKRIFRPTLVALAATWCAAGAVAQQAGLALSAGAFHVGQRAVNNLNQAFVGSYTTLSVGARSVTKLAGRPVALQANLDNASDRDYWATAGNGLLGASLPRVGMKVDL